MKATTRVLSLLMVVLGAIASGHTLRAQEVITTDYLVITHADASSEEIDLSTIQRISFIQNNSVMQLALPNARYRRITIDPTDSYTFRRETVEQEEETFGADFTVTDPNEDKPWGPTTIGNVLMMRPAGAGQSTTFAFSDVVAATGLDFRQSAKYGVRFTVSAAKMGGDIDCADEWGTYTLTLFDYTTGTYVDADEGVSGSIVTRQREDGTIAFRLNVVLQNGVRIEGSYSGTPVVVNDLEGIVPLPVLPNEYTYTEPSGTIVTQNEVVALQLRKSTDGHYYFYFMKPGETTPDDRNYYTPQIMVDPSLINAGELKLPEVNKPWAVNYIELQLSYADNEWKPVTDNGLLRIAYDEATGIYDIYLTLANSYVNMGYAGGNKRSITINYHGPASPYTGTRK